MIRAIIFDFDGVILDSVDIKTKAFARLFEEHGPEVVQQVVDYHLAHGGVSRFRKFAYIYENILSVPLTAAESALLGDRFSALVFDEVVKAAWIPGAREFLEENYRHYQFFVASGTPQEELQKIVELRQLTKYFHGVFGSPATKMEISRRLVKERGLQTHELLFIGDAMTDFEAAQACGITFVGVAARAGQPFPAGTKILSDLRSLASVIARAG